MTVNQLLLIVDRERMIQGYTGEGISEKAGFQKSMYCRWINGKNAPNLRNFIHILDILGLELKITRKKDKA